MSKLIWKNWKINLKRKTIKWSAQGYMASLWQGCTFLYSAGVFPSPSTAGRGSSRMWAWRYVEQTLLSRSWQCSRSGEKIQPRIGTRTMSERNSKQENKNKGLPTAKSLSGCLAHSKFGNEENILNLMKTVYDIKAMRNKTTANIILNDKTLKISSSLVKASLLPLYSPLFCSL